MAIMMMTIIVMIITGTSINQYNIHHTKENHETINIITTWIISQEKKINKWANLQKEKL